MQTLKPKPLLSEGKYQLMNKENIKTAEVFITEKYEHNNWGFYPPSRRLVAEWMEDYAKHYHKEQLTIEYEM